MAIAQKSIESRRFPMASLQLLMKELGGLTTQENNIELVPWLWRGLNIYQARVNKILCRFSLIWSHTSLRNYLLLKANCFVPVHSLINNKSLCLSFNKRSRIFNLSFWRNLKPYYFIICFLVFLFKYFIEALWATKAELWHAWCSLFFVWSNHVLFIIFCLSFISSFFLLCNRQKGTQ